MPVRDHPTSLAGRVRAARLEQTPPTAEPAAADIRRIASASSPGPAALPGLMSRVEDPRPEPGQVWRVGRHEALLVWVRTTSARAVEVSPVVLDVELADSATLLLPADATPLGLELALMTGVRERVDRRAFLQHVADLDVGGEVAAIEAAARSDHLDGDQRVEYRHAIADVLAGLTPGAWDGALREPPEPDTGDLVALLARELPARHADTQVHRIPARWFRIDQQRELVCCARVAYLDSSLIVAELTGPGASLDDIAGLAPACADILRAEPATDAVAVTLAGGDRQSVVLAAPDVRTAYEPPGGQRRGPRVLTEPLGVVDALAKHLDRQAEAWEITEPIASVLGSVDVAALVARNARAAVSRLSAEGRRALTPAKQAAWANLPADFAAAVAEAVVAISANHPLESVLDRLARRDDA